MTASVIPLYLGHSAVTAIMHAKYAVPAALQSFTVVVLVVDE